MYGYIYQTTNLINGKKYIGQHRSSKFDHNYIGSGILLLKAIEKYGKENFSCEILRECYSDDELNNYEKEYIAFYNAVNSTTYYNVAAGGEGHTCTPWNKGLTSDSDDRVKQCSTNMKNTKQSRTYTAWNKGLTTETSDKLKEIGQNISKSLKGRHDSEETKKKKSSCKQGHKNNMYGKHHTEEARRKVGLANSTAWMCNGIDKPIKVPYEKVDEYTQLGYKRGRIFKPDNV